jgi:hypothetical protein
MERVHQLLMEGILAAEDDAFWRQHWQYIASARVPLATKVAAYNALKPRGFITINNLHLMRLYEMMVADRHFVEKLDLDDGRLHCYRLFITWIDDDVVALAKYSQKLNDQPTFLWSTLDTYGVLKRTIREVMMKVNAPRCIRFMLQDKAFREEVMMNRMSPLVQRVAEEFVQPTDFLESWLLLWHGQSVKLIGMCVKDEELVATWLPIGGTISRGATSVPFARKLYALATPVQSAQIKLKVMRVLLDTVADEGHFELAWLLGLLGPFDLLIQKRFLTNDLSSFPAFTFAMIVAMCDGYLEISRSGISEAQRRFFNCVIRLPMDLQALMSLRLWGKTSTVIHREQFDRALLAVI